MTTRTVERSDEWEAVPFSGGFAGLHELADEEFSGKIVAGPTRVFMLRGSVVGLLGGSIEDVDGQDGTAREAPHPALPLLAVMQERSDEVRAKYYSEDTPMSEVDRTLEDGNFTGYIELSENVLSGDYYQVYHQGRSMSVAWVGAAERLITDDEAFEQADDEVGIYEVRPVDIEVVEIPEPADGVGAGGGTTGGDTTEASPAGPGASDASGGMSESGADEPAAPEPDGSEPEPAADAGETGPAGASADESPAASDPTSTQAEERGEGSSTTPSESPGTGTSGAADDPTAGAEANTSRQRSESETSRQSTDPEPQRGGTGSSPSSSRQPTGRAVGEGSSRQPSTGRSANERQAGGHEAGRSADPANGGAGRSAGGHDAESGEDLTAEDLETRSLPSLDPDRTASGRQARRSRGGGARQHAGSQQHPGAPAEAATGGASTGEADESPQQGRPGEPTGGEPGQSPPAEEGPPAGGDTGTPPEPSEARAPSEPEREGPPTSEPEPTPAEEDSPEPQQESPPEPETGAGDAGASVTEGPADTQEAVAEQVEEVEQLQSELGNLEGERDEIAEERDRLESQLDEAREELERLRGRLDDAVGDAADAEVGLSPREAIEETNLFVRYNSKGDATLENAHAGDAERAAVDENLRLEYHTAFDADDAAVDGRPFDDFLTETIQYRFVDWLVRDLLYEIRDTGHGGRMADLFDAIPRIDRVELNGLVTVTYTKNGQENRSQEGFDIVVRDRMGNPLLVANINDSRDPATDEMMTDLVTTGERVGESNETLAGAFLVTKSFFEPASLETAEEATSGGLLSRDKRESFVNLSRKGGYHLCLVEARNQEFHLTVPEL